MFPGPRPCRPLYGPVPIGTDGGEVGSGSRTSRRRSGTAASGLFEVLLEVKDSGELRSWVAELPWFDAFEEHDELPHRLIRVGVTLQRDVVFLLGPRGMGPCTFLVSSGGRSPRIPQDHHEVVARLKVLVDDGLGPTDPTKGLFPADGLEVDTSADCVVLVEVDQHLAESFSFDFEATG